MISRALRPVLIPLALFVFAAVAVFLLASVRYARADDPVLLDAGSDVVRTGPADVPVVILPATPASPCLDPDGPHGLKPCGPIPDVFEQPAETWDAARYYWQAGGWPFTVFLLLVVAGVLQVQLRPKDRDGDGDPDPEGWRGALWIGSGAVIMVGVPVLAWLLRRAGVDTGSAGGIGAIAVAAVGAVGMAINPWRRAPVRAVA